METAQLLLGSRETFTAEGDRYGGRPFVPKNFKWPTCKQCESSLEFIGQLHHHKRLYSIFYCIGADVCATWEPETESGANKVYVYDENELEDAILMSGTIRKNVIGITRAPFPDPSKGYDDTRCDEQYRSLKILGQIGGTPSWIQGDETPNCDKCNKEMSFVAHVEEGITPYNGDDVNYGGGVGYLFECEEDKRSLFLWQQ